MKTRPLSRSHLPRSLGAWLAAFTITILAAPAAWSAPAQQALVIASNLGTNDNFGFAVTVSGDTMVVGAYGEDSNAIGVNGDGSNNAAADSGAAYVFVRNGTNWTQQAYLKAFNTGADDSFGYAVAVSGDTIAIGSPGEASSATGANGDGNNNSAPFAGAVYIFVRSGTNWTQQAYLKASNTDMSDNFGYSVAVSGDTVVVGAYAESSHATGVNGSGGDNSAPYSGAAYVFARSGTNWSQEAYLKASNARPFNDFGYAVAVSGDTVIVGAFGEESSATGVNGDQDDLSATGAGAAYVFVRSGTDWSQQAYLKASNTEAGDSFGAAVAISGDTVVIGAYNESSVATGVNGDQSDNNALASGAAYVFVRNGIAWNQQAYLKASNTGLDDNFGFSVAVAGDSLVVGALGEDSVATGVNGDGSGNGRRDSGAAYAFVRNGTTWQQRAYLKASDTGRSAFLGLATAVSGDTVIAGAYAANSSYVFTGLGGGPRLTLVPDGSGGYFIRCAGQAGLSYGLLRAPSVTGPWDTLDTLIAPASGLVEFHDTSPLPGMAYYRTVNP